LASTWQDSKGDMWIYSGMIVSVASDINSKNNGVYVLQDATYYYFASDPLKGEVTYSTDAHRPVNLIVISANQAKSIIEMNRRGEKPMSLGGKQSSMDAVEIDYQNVVGQDDLTRFDKKRRNKNNGDARKPHHNKKPRKQ
jgi:hypothetical protein